MSNSEAIGKVDGSINVQNKPIEGKTSFGGFTIKPANGAARFTQMPGAILPKRNQDDASSLHLGAGTVSRPKFISSNSVRGSSGAMDESEPIAVVKLHEDNKLTEGAGRSTEAEQTRDFYNKMSARIESDEQKDENIESENDFREIEKEDKEKHELFREEKKKESENKRENQAISDQNIENNKSRIEGAVMIRQRDDVNNKNSDYNDRSSDYNVSR